MAVVMLSEGCNCGCSNTTFSTLVNKMAIGGPAGCMMSEQPLLSSRLGNWIRENVCPACHRAIDNLGDSLPNIANAAGNLTVSSLEALQQINQGIGTGIGGFIANPENIPCAIGVVGTAFGAPMGLGGCAPQGFNEQNQTFIPAPGLFSNPLLLGGLGLMAVLLLTQKK